MLKKIFFGLFALLAAAQFFRPAKNLGASPGPNDIAVRYPVPPEVRRTLESACFDCHSNSTQYPWYASVQPVGWWLARHIRDGRRHLNFSEFAAYEPRRAAHKLQQIIDELDDREMPLASYKILHPDARLTDTQIQQVTDWAKRLKAQFPQ
jgi:hypothetical protein